MRDIGSYVQDSTIFYFDNDPKYYLIVQSYYPETDYVTFTSREIVTHTYNISISPVL